MENQIEIKIVDGFWTINNKKVANCSHAKKDFFDKYVKLNLIKSAITEKSNSTFKTKSNEVKKIIKLSFYKHRKND